MPKGLIRLIPFLILLWALAQGQALENLAPHRDATERIEGGDGQFLSTFDIYHAGTKEYPIALLLDLKGDPYRIASYLWGDPIGLDEALYAIRRMEERYRECPACFPRPPQALAVVNRKGQLVGYVYTFLSHLFMERAEDGKVKVFLPEEEPRRDRFKPPWPMGISFR